MSPDSRLAMRTVHGLGVSAGVAIGRAVCLETRAVDIYRIPIDEEEVPAEIERLHEAVRRTESEIRRSRDRAADLGEELAAIFDAHVLMLADSSFLERIEAGIRRERVNAEWVVHRTTEELVDRFAKLDDARWSERGDDLRDVGRYLLRTLQGIDHHDLSEMEEDVVIVADDLTPSDAVRLGRARVVGFAIETGGRTSHTTIIARSLGLPLVTGLDGVLRLEPGDGRIIVDGDQGVLILHPDEPTLTSYLARRETLQRREAAALMTRDLRPLSRDGVEVSLQANIDLPEEIQDALRFGAMGVGLYRSEFLYIERSPELPTEEDHLALYRELAAASAPHTAVIRTYDLGGRKLAREVMHTREENPVLGLRGIRLTLARPQVFRPQMRALLRAATHGNLRILLPMVSTIEEIRQFRAFTGAIARELESEGLEFRREVPIGAMIEVPSAALIADLLAREVDFFAIGTNDLIQYSLAVDRNNEHVTDLYQPLHPAMVRMLRFVVESARVAGIPLSVCGEMAADARFVPLLIGLGVRTLSMSPRSIPQIKALIRDSSVAELERLVRQCGDLPTATDVEAHLERGQRAATPTA